jgi:PAS domain S-box-containing protein
MQRSFKTRLLVILIGFFTVAAIIFASVNLSKESTYEVPTDGVRWTEAQGGLLAEAVPAGSPGDEAGIRPGDLLVGVRQAANLSSLAKPIERMSALEREFFHRGTFQRIDYILIRYNVRIDASVVLVAAGRSQYQELRLIALIYLLIGLYVLFRRWTAPRATHFYLFCLASFVLYAFHATGRFNTFDWTIYWSNIVAGALQPALFLHFALAFPEERTSGRRRNWLIGLTYAPAAAVVALQVVAQSYWSATALLSHRLDQIAMGYLAFYYALAAIVFFVNYQRNVNPLRRQQLKWLFRGTFVAVAPFTLLYVIPFLADWTTPEWVTNVAAISLVILPLTFSWAIVRYRLMDVDLIFKRGVTYTLATATLVGLYLAAVAVSAAIVHTQLARLGEGGLVAAIILAALIFEPIKKRIQERVDRLFDRKRFDYRQTLTEFGRGLSSQTDLETLLKSICDRLPRTLLLSRVAIFLSGPRGQCTLAAGHGLPPTLYEPGADLHLGFLDFDQPGASTHIFLETPQQALYLPEEQRRTAATLDLNYYIPCRVQDKTIAVIGFGRTADGDFLSSEDVELLESLASYIGIAIQNARLYASLAEKASEYERLKEFNENIVESINVGILAIDFEERIESWNAQMEVMYALPRIDALGRPLESVFPADFMEEFHRRKDEPGVHNLYKYRLKTHAGEVRTANIAIAPLVSRTLNIVGRIILVDDITERVQLEGQLTQAEKLSSIGLLAAGVAHEVNTPLAVISSYTQMLAKQVRDDERLSKLLDKITQQTFRASEIVNGLLNFSRTSATEFQEIDLNHTIRETLTLLEHQFKTSQVDVDLDLDEVLPPIMGNPGKLQQVFLNLFLNARDAMPGGGRLQVGTVCNGHVSVAIADSGMGISPEHMQKIYDPFFTTKSAPKEGQRRGTGLGLAVTYGIIQEHAGKIVVESKVGSGTTFHLEFPLVRKPAHV